MNVIRNNDKYFIINGVSSKKLSPGNYLVNQNHMNKEFYLTKQKNFELPDKIYGNSISKAKKYINTFNLRKGNLGVLLKGLKGTGKTLLAKQTCIESKLPVIIIDKCYNDGNFSEFLSSITQECVIFIDEFEKVFGEEDQESLLSIFNGAFESKKLFLLTANDGHIDSHFLNRPGRIFYLKKFNSLNRKIVKQIIDDTLINKNHIKKLMKVCDIIYRVTFDILYSLIWEINTYDIPPKRAARSLNISPEISSFEITFKEEDKKLSTSKAKTYKNYVTIAKVHPLTCVALGHTYVYEPNKIQHGTYQTISFKTIEYRKMISHNEYIVKANDIKYHFKRIVDKEFKF